MKRILASALSAALLLTMLAGCGGNNNSSNNGSSNTGTSSASNTSSGDKVVKIGVFEPQSGDNGAGWLRLVCLSPSPATTAPAESRKSWECSTPTP